MEEKDKMERGKALEDLEACSHPIAMAALIPGPGKALEDEESIEFAQNGAKERYPGCLGCRIT